MNFNTEEMENFFKWFIRLGGNIYDQYSEHIMYKFLVPPPMLSSFKHRAKEIKHKYNHKFIHNDPLRKEPNINNLKFERNDGSRVIRNTRKT